MRQTLGKLESRFDALPKPAAARLRKLLAHSRGLNRRAGTDGRRQALLRLGQTASFFTGKAPRRSSSTTWSRDWSSPTARHARRSAQAYAKPSDEAFHAWRKRVQLHWRHMALLSRGWPEAMSARASEAKELSRLLGEDHDYSVLLAFAGEQRGKHLAGAEDLQALTALCRVCQAELRAAARPRGERLFAERAERPRGARAALLDHPPRCLAALARAKAAQGAREGADEADPRASPSHAQGRRSAQGSRRPRRPPRHLRALPCL